MRWSVAGSLFAAQFIALGGLCWLLYHRFTLGIDFAVYAQAYHQIGHGHLDPHLTIFGYPYLDSHFELLMWPMALVLSVFSTPFMLLLVQAACLVGANAVAFAWISEMVDGRELSGRVRLAIEAFGAVVLLLDPLVYFSVGLDFHFEAIATLFVVLAARSLWKGSARLAMVWIALCLLCGDVGGLYVVGVGLSVLLAGSPSRRAGLAMMIAGVVWIGIIGALGANQGSDTYDYAYLAGRTSLPRGFAGGAVLLGGIVAHPGRPLAKLARRLHFVARYLSFGGFIGFASAWGVGVPLVVLLASGLQRTDLFIGEPFQQVAVVPFVLFGTVSLLTGLAAGGWRRLISRPKNIGRRLRVASLAAAVGLFGLAVYTDQRELPHWIQDNAAGELIPAAEAATLRQILSRTPSDAEVISSLPISGRFGARRYIYLYIHPSGPIPVEARTVVLVIDTGHTVQLASPAQDHAALDYARRQLHARTIGAGSYVEAVEWNPAPGQTQVRLP